MEIKPIEFMYEENYLPDGYSPVIYKSKEDLKKEMKQKNKEEDSTWK